MKFVNYFQRCSRKPRRSSLPGVPAGRFHRFKAGLSYFSYLCLNTHYNLMMRSLPLLILLFFIGVSNAFSQNKDTVILMNGNVVVETVVDTSLGAVTIPNPGKPGKRLHYEFEDIFCVHYASGHKHYYYSQDSLRSNWYTRDEMYMFTKGEADARKGFTARGAAISAGILGFIGGATGTFFGPILPYGFMASSGIPKIRIRHSTISNPNYIDYDTYILGYERTARYKRRIRSLTGGTIGLALGYAAYFVLFKNYFDTGKIGFGK